MSLKYVDSHCHLDMLDLSDFDNHMDNVIKQAEKNKVTDILSIAVDLDSFPRILETARTYPNVYASVGLHPCHSPENTIRVDDLTILANDSKVIAIGETGLDYYMNNGSDPLNEDFSWQRQRFRTHIRTAIKTSKPLIIHTRDARDDTLAILEEENAEKIGGIMHCFVEDTATAEKALEIGFYISFSGIVTFKNARSIQEVAKWIPDNRLLIETDSPYLAPVPMRGKKNQPAYVAYVAEFLAELRGASVEHIARVTRENYFKLFKLNDPLI
ncbi:MAG: TatD family hydrolase [gamma proteobacterium symbiont of Bathyaustriella thionipta]|nr:TatD family hydrolase [gamma proteobacterium symbiont of Bathyaustriella thionipta]MCU7949115.1 TatD family hydrolase [gamma proteobacterium symbiont of Bathyaustriella thionipta]MCU7954426.1 TatD family hydrolase [gamma proteobacterium symbiont of Bathyaustriella thionipta]MCU7955712.1 TatD family hydrolase [gamma proteobacterium symbiont of Bathyaustriella thionipta]MCU7966194.1 TatD family hydrolase [gamma proteobacterium symbiont of Bathyaustriella thionipta]